MKSLDPRTCLVGMVVSALACSAPIAFPPDTESPCPPTAVPTPLTPVPPPSETSGPPDESDGSVPDETSSEETSADGPDSEDDCDELEARAQDILLTNCHSCHQPGGQAANTGIPDILRTNDMIASGKLVPGSPFESVLFTRVKADTMPPADKEPRPSSEEVDLIEEWISCVPEEDDCDNAFVDIDQVLEEILDDVQSLDAIDRPFARYLSFAHLNNQNLCAEEIERYRYAARRTLNGLSTNPGLQNPKPIDGAALVYRVDMRDYDWDESPQTRFGNSFGDDDDDDDGDKETARDLWALLVQNNPFQIRYIQEDARTIAEFVREPNFLIHADWMTHDANTGQLYYDLARVPGTLGELEDLVGINIAQNIRDREVQRIGFLESGVSDQNRIIERHELPGGRNQSFWLSYDFADNGGKENVFSNPLDFEEDGGEIIYSLPNGLTAFAITNAAGVVLDAAATEIVVDPNQQDSVVRPGVSCLTCHGVGYIPAEDEILSFILSSQDFQATEKEDVAELHPRRTDSALTIAQDTAQYIATEQVLLPPPNRGALPPVAWAYYEWDANVDLKKAAAELGLEESIFLRNIGGLDPQLAPLGSGGNVSREVWETFFADVVCQLNIGFADSRFCFNQPTPRFNVYSCRLKDR